MRRGPAKFSIKKQMTYCALLGFSSQNYLLETENYIYIGGNTGTIWGSNADYHCDRLSGDCERCLSGPAARLVLITEVRIQRSA